MPPSQDWLTCLRLPRQRFVRIASRLGLAIKNLIFGLPSSRDRHLSTRPEDKDLFRKWGYFSGKWSNSPRILMAAGHGYGNVGDEAQCGACISRWKTAIPGCHITLFTPNPDYTEHLHRATCAWAPRVAWFRANTTGPYDGHSLRYRIFHATVSMRLRISAHLIKRGIPALLCHPREAVIFSLLQSHDILHISGGGFLTGRTRSRLWENCLLMRLCQILKVPYILTGQTIGVFRDNRDRWLAKLALRKALYIGLRDQHLSQGDLRAIGIAGPHVVSTCDDALLSPKFSSTEALETLARAGLSEATRIAIVNFHHWGQDKASREEIEVRFAAICDTLVATHKLQVVFVGMTPTDIPAEQNIATKMREKATIIPYSPDYRLVRSLIAIARIVVTFKHHPIVFAQGEGTPVTSIALDDYYRHKNLGALQNSGHEKYLIDETDFWKPTAEQTITICLECSDQIRTEMLSFTDAMRDVEMEPYSQSCKRLQLG